MERREAGQYEISEEGTCRGLVHIKIRDAMRERGKSVRGERKGEGQVSVLFNWLIYVSVNSYGDLKGGDGDDMIRQKQYSYTFTEVRDLSHPTLHRKYEDWQMPEIHIGIAEQV